MTKTIELAKQAGLRNLSGIEKFAELVRADERQRLLAVAGEPVDEVKYWHSVIDGADFARPEDDYYTADQVAAAVLLETERCAKVCESMHEEDRPSDYAYAIRARGEG